MITHPLKDSDPMPYGKYKDRKMEEVPASYLMYLYENNRTNHQVKQYILLNWDTIQQEIKQGINKHF